MKFIRNLNCKYTRPSSTATFSKTSWKSRKARRTRLVLQCVFAPATVVDRRNWKGNLIKRYVLANGAVNASSTIINGLDRRRCSFCRNNDLFARTRWALTGFQCHLLCSASLLIAGDDEDYVPQLRSVGNLRETINFRAIKILIALSWINIKLCMSVYSCSNKSTRKVFAIVNKNMWRCAALHYISTNLLAYSMI